MKIEIWSDVVCPWCSIGKKRLESALSRFEHRDQVEILWRSFELDPTSPRSSEETMSEILARKYGRSPQQVAQQMKQIADLAAEDGLDFHLEQSRPANTFDAHRLIHLAATHGKQGEMKSRLLHAYVTESLPVGEIDTLVQLASEVGLDADEVRTALNSDAYADEVVADEQRAQAFSITGVPFFAIDEKYGISGAQPIEVFTQALEQAWADSHPLIKVFAGSQDAGTCEGDNCAL